MILSMTIATYVMVIYALVELIVVSIMHRLTMAMNWTFSKPIFEETQEWRSIVTLAAFLLQG